MGRVTNEAPTDVRVTADYWPIFCGTHQLARFLILADLLRSTLTVPGHIGEFGVHHGRTLFLLARVLHIYQANSLKTVYGFDAFEGLQTFSPEDGDAAERFRGDYTGSLAVLRQHLPLLGQYDSRVEIVSGDICETLPALHQRDPSISWSFVFLDVDLYAPTRVILQEVHERIMPGGVIVCDEWGYPEWPGESLAVREFLRDHGADYTLTTPATAPQPSLVLRRKS